MKERAIDFTPNEIKQLLLGHRTQTRRVIDLEFPDYIEFKKTEVPGRYCSQQIDGKRLGRVESPFGIKGDRLWVREGAFFKTVIKRRVIYLPLFQIETSYYISESDIKRIRRNGYRFKNSRFMPRWASRILLEVTGVKIERLTAISGPDRIREGCRTGYTAMGGFRWEWDNQHDDDEGWDVNPWVWVVSFKILKIKGKGLK
jgi:hypothetical protein